MDTEQSTADRVRDAVSEVLDIDRYKLQGDMRLVGNLGADSLDVVKIVMAIESEFGIEIPDERAERIVTVGDIEKMVEELLAAKDGQSQ